VSEGATLHVSALSVQCLSFISWSALSTSATAITFAFSAIARRSPIGYATRRSVRPGKSSGRTIAIDSLPVPATMRFDSPLQTA